MSVFNASGANNQQGNSINDLQNNAPKSYNHFSNSYSAMLTGRFGDITPFFVMDTPPDANIQLSCPHVLDTYTLKAPIRNTINLRKSYYSVSFASLYHRTFSKFYQLPDKGDDVPTDCYIGFNVIDLKKWLSQFKMSTSSISDFTARINYDFRFLSLMSFFIGNGTLLNSMRQPLPSHYFNHSSFDNFMDLYFVDLMKAIDRSDAPSGSKHLIFSNMYKGQIIFDVSSDISNLRAAFYYYRQNPQEILSTITSGNYPLIVDNVSGATFIQQTTPETSFPFNLHRPLAYQLVCAQYYSNENVDFIYSEELYRNNADSLFSKLFRSQEVGSPYFPFNGTKVYYDTYSKKWNDTVFTLTEITDGLIGYWSNLLCFNNSLTTSDYFTGGRTRPLAQADISITQTGSGVTAIDVAKKLSLARFAHAVNKTSSQLYSYLKGIFGVNLSLDDKFPRWLADSLHNVKNPVTVNTSGDKSELNGTGQGSVSSNLTDSSDSNQYFFHCELPSIILGLATFEFSNFYERAIDRHCLHSDRMDMFQPYLQTIGDQSISPFEVGSKGATQLSQVFSWIVRNGEYKERFSTLHGGFVDYLKIYRLKPVTAHASTVIDGNFIRRHNEDFDFLYTSLAGSSPAHYFHFQLLITADCQCNYNMIRKPQIL